MKGFLVSVAFLCLLVLFLQPAPVTIGGEEEKPEYVGMARCKMCHNRASSGKYVDSWEETLHAKAFEALKGGEQKDPKCLPCHTTGYGEPGGFASLEETPKMVGVQCEVCHGPGELHIKSKPDNVIPNQGVPTEETCVKCHREEGNPNWNPEKYTKPDGTKTGFYFEEAVKKINHQDVRDALEK